MGQSLKMNVNLLSSIHEDCQNKENPRLTTGKKANALSNFKQGIGSRHEIQLRWM